MHDQDEFDLDVRLTSGSRMWASQQEEQPQAPTGHGGQLTDCLCATDDPRRHTCADTCQTCDTHCGTCPGDTCGTQCGQNTCPLTQCHTCDTCHTNCQQNSCPGGFCPPPTFPIGGGHTCDQTCVTCPTCPGGFPECGDG